jgi:hypothetical protein
MAAMAARPSTSEQNFCRDRANDNYIKKLVTDSDNMMSFRNHGGLLNGGVCWWHSRFQRNALYLTIFKADLPKPTREEAQEIIKKIRWAKDVVIIPGFSNFKDFTMENESLVQRELEKWQKGDGFVRMSWVKGLEGASEVAPEILKNSMDEIYNEVEVNKNIAYNKLQIPGIDAHAWLVVGMEKVKTGYLIKVLDSNFNDEIQTYFYQEGDTSLNYHRAFRFVPYLEKTNEMGQIKKTIDKFCGK